jgi:hypothetical protein
MAGPLLFDGRNALDPWLMRSLGFDYLAFGRTRIPGAREARMATIEGARQARIRSAHARGR